MSVRIARYEEAMATQVVDLFHRHYGVARDAFLDRFTRFYEHPYQSRRCVRVVALDGNTVVGFAGFVAWPYALEGREFRSLQCCDVLVGAAHRGSGAFPRILDFAHEHADADFVVGFPVATATNAFLRNGWRHILDLEWYVKLLDPLAFLRGEERITEAAALRRESRSRLRLTDDAAFIEWRRGYSRGNRYFARWPFELKAIRRRGVLRELIVGDVRADDADFDDVARNARGVTYASIALNPLDPLLRNVLRARFRKIKRTIPLIVKAFSCEELISDAARWRLFRSDLDTW